MELALCLFRGNATSVGEVDADATPPPGLPPLLLATVSRTLRFMRRSAAFFSGPFRVATVAVDSVSVGFLFFSSSSDMEEIKGARMAGDRECEEEEVIPSSRLPLRSTMRMISLCPCSKCSADRLRGDPRCGGGGGC